MDDPRIAEGTDYFHYRKIDYRRTGGAGAGQSVHVSLTGLDGVPFEVEIDAEGVPLTTEGAGLTNQSGHGADRVVMLFHRKRSARAERNRVTIGGEDYSFRAGDDPEGMHRFRAAYSAGIQIVVFPFGQWTFEGDETRLSSEAAGFSFTVEGREDGAVLVSDGAVLVSDLLGYNNRTAIELDADGGPGTIPPRRGRAPHGHLFGRRPAAHWAGTAVGQPFHRSVGSRRACRERARRLRSYRERPAPVLDDRHPVMGGRLSLRIAR